MLNINMADHHRGSSNGGISNLATRKIKNGGNSTRRNMRKRSAKSQVAVCVEGNRQQMSQTDADLVQAKLQQKLYGDGHNHNDRPESEAIRSVGSGGDTGIASDTAGRTVDRDIVVYKTKRSEVKLAAKEGAHSKHKKSSQNQSRKETLTHHEVRSSRLFSPTTSTRSQSAKIGSRRAASRMLMSLDVSMKANPHIKMPFKHSVRKPSEKLLQTPSQALVERTVLATCHINNLLSTKVDTVTKKKSGSLLKGKLRPLYPVNISGPSICQCRGIISDVKAYLPSASRTWQCRQQLATHLKTRELELPSKSSTSVGGFESVHRVSAASSVEDAEDQAKDLQELTTEPVHLEREVKMSFSKESSSTLSKDDSSTRSPETTDSQNQDIGSAPDPFMETFQPQDDSRSGLRHINVEDAKDKSRSSTAGSSSCISVEKTVPEEAETQERDESSVQGSQLVRNANNNFQKEGFHGLSPEEVKRAQSANVQCSCPRGTCSKAQVRPKTTGSAKVVSFAKHSHSSDGSSSRTGQERGRKEENKTKGTVRGKQHPRGSCKPPDLGKKGRRDEHDDDRGGDRVNKDGGNGKVGVCSRQTTVASKTNELEAEKNGFSGSPSDQQVSSSQSFENKEGISSNISVRTQNCIEESEKGEPASGTVVSTAAAKLTASPTRSLISEERTVQDRNLSQNLITKDVAHHGGKAVQVGSLPTDTSVCTASSSLSFPLISTAGEINIASDLPIVGSRSSPNLKTWASFECENGKTKITSPPVMTLSLKLGTEEGVKKANVPEEISLLKLLLEVSAEMGSLSSLSGESSDRSAKALSATSVGSSVGSEILHSSSSKVFGNISDDLDHLESTVSRQDGTAPVSNDQQPCLQAVQAEPVTVSDERPSEIAVKSSEVRQITSEPTPARQQSASNSSRLATKSAAHAESRVLKSADETTAKGDMHSCKNGICKARRGTPRAAHLIQHGAGKGTCQKDGTKDSEHRNSQMKFTEANNVRKENKPKAARSKRRNSCVSSVSEMSCRSSCGTICEETSSAVKDKNLHSGGGPKDITGILKKNIQLPACHCKPQGQSKELLNVTCKFPQRKKSSGYKVSSDEQNLLTKPRGKRQTFTHHSSKPFIYTNHDFFSAAVAVQLKYGDSPYLTELKLPVRPGLKRRMKEKCSSGKAVDKNKVKESPTSLSVVEMSEAGKKESRVKFTGAPRPSLDLNQNCASSSYEAHTVIEVSLCSEGGWQQSTQVGISGRTEKQVQTGIYLPENYVCIFQNDYEKDVRFAARFKDRGSELIVVGTEIAMTVLSNERQQLLEEADNFVRIPKGEDVSGSEYANETASLSFCIVDQLCEKDDLHKEKRDNAASSLPSVAGKLNEKDDVEKEKQHEREKCEDGKDQILKENVTGVSVGPFNIYSSYLVEYRQKCLMVGEGNLVISDKITWPFASLSRTSPLRIKDLSRIHHSKDCMKNCTEKLSELCCEVSGSRKSKYSGKQQSDSLASQVVCSQYTSQSGSSCWESESLPDSRSEVSEGYNRSLVLGRKNASSHANRNVPSASCSAMEKNWQIRTAAAERYGNKTLRQKAAFQLSSDRTKVSSSCDGPASPLPPLCFHVTMQPPPGLHFCFACSSHMNLHRICSLLQRHFDKCYWALLFGFDIVFNKKVSGLKDSIVLNPFSSVEDCILLINPTELDHLNAVTRAPQHFKRVALPVWLSEDKSGLARFCVPPYIAQDEWTMTESCIPAEYAIAKYLTSADLLTPNCRKHLQRMVSAASHPHHQLLTT